VPTRSDILKVDASTVGLEEHLVRVSPNLLLRTCDVSGAKGQRPVWSTFFEDGAWRPLFPWWSCYKDRSAFIVPLAACIIYFIDGGSFDAPGTGSGNGTGSTNVLEESFQNLAKLCQNEMLQEVDIYVFM